MKYKFMSSDTKEKLKILNRYKKKLDKMTPKEQKQELINTGLYNHDGSLIEELK